MRAFGKDVVVLAIVWGMCGAGIVVNSGCAGCRIWAPGRCLDTFALYLRDSCR